ncbi:MAG: hypothetical protein HYV07_06700 [Deltaproteobacteria bacterium]|nr:hypothetical protein [Deltaproteobacteria bacterium]
MSTALLSLILLAQSPFVAEGVIKEVSGGPGTTMVELRMDAGERVLLLPRGELDPNELRSLSTVRVRVRGERGDPAGPGGTYARIDTYEILDVGKGAVPRVGILGQLELQGEKRLVFVDDAGQADVLPKGWGQKLGGSVGAKLWMVGTGSGENFAPTRFQVLRPKKKAPSATP